MRVFNNLDYREEEDKLLKFIHELSDDDPGIAIGLLYAVAKQVEHDTGITTIVKVMGEEADA